MNEMDEFHLCTYEIWTLYKEKMKLNDDHKIERREFISGDLVLLFDSRLMLLHG